MFPIGRKASADQPAATEAADGAAGGLVLPKPLRKPFRHAMRLFNQGVIFSASTLAVVSGLIAGAAGVIWLRESGQGERLVAMATAQAGFRIAEIEVTGTNETSRIDVLTRIDLGSERSLFSFDVHAARESLLSLPWVADARVSKSYPDRLLVEITERRPFAVWQHRGELQLIERDGRAIVPFSEKFAGLPLVVGEGANLRAADILTTASRHPSVAERVVAYVRIGERRWNLNLANGAVVLLGETGEAAQIAELDRLRGEEGLFERQVQRIDMRLPDRLVLRLPPDAAEIRREAVTARIKAKAKAEKDT